MSFGFLDIVVGEGVIGGGGAVTVNRPHQGYEYFQFRF